MKSIVVIVLLGLLAAAGYYGWRYAECSGYTATSPEEVALVKRAAELYPDSISARTAWISDSKTASATIKAKCAELKSSDAELLAKLSVQKYPDDPNARLEWFTSQTAEMQAFLACRSSGSFSDSEFAAVGRKAAELYPHDWHKRRTFAERIGIHFNNVSASREKIPSDEFKVLYAELLKAFEKSPDTAFSSFFDSVEKTERFYSELSYEFTDGAREYLVKTGKPIAERLSILESYNKNPAIHIPSVLVSQSRFSLADFGMIAPKIRKMLEESLYFAEVAGVEYAAPLVKFGDSKFFVLPVGALFCGATKAEFKRGNEKIQANIARVGTTFAFYQTSAVSEKTSVGVGNADSSCTTLSLVGTNPFGKTVSRHLMSSGVSDDRMFFFEEESPYLLSSGALAVDVAADNAIVAIALCNRISQPEIGEISDSLISLKLRGAKRPMFGLRKSLGARSFTSGFGSNYGYYLLKRGFEKSEVFNAENYAAELAALRRIAKGNKILFERLVRNDFSGFLDDEVKDTLPRVHSVAEKCKKVFLESPSKVPSRKFSEWYCEYARMMARAIRSDANVNPDSFEKCLLETLKRELKLRWKLADSFDAAANVSNLAEVIHGDMSKNLSSGVYCAKP